ncbi:hypothetical protein DL93DRAFT_551014 [Clavulina sp. PMI_390]|nr:hypothetical protein DL93DRAFT_551014 [Clavulina sp. PMI_390]
MNEPPLRRVRVTGRAPSLARPVLARTMLMSRTLDCAQELESTAPQPMLLHLLTTTNVLDSAPFRSSCVQVSVSIPDLNRESSIPPPSLTLSTSSSFSTRQIDIKYAIFPYCGQTFDADLQFDISPSGDMLFLSLGTDPASGDTASGTVNAEPIIRRLQAEMIHPVDLLPAATDLLPSVHMEGNADTIEASLKQVERGVEQCDPGAESVRRIIDLGEAGEASFTYIDWWNGAVVQQTQTFGSRLFLRTRKITPAT